MGALQPKGEAPHLAGVGVSGKASKEEGFCSRSGSGPRECWEHGVEINFPAEGGYCGTVEL